MQKIKPVITSSNIKCAEQKAAPCSFIVFGASGDLTARKLLPSLFSLFKKNLLDENFFFLGIGRKQLSDYQFKELTHKAISKNHSDAEKEKLNSFVTKLYYLAGNYDDSSLYKTIKTKIIELNKKHNTENNTVFYLSVPPFLYPTIVHQLGQANLSCPSDISERKTKLVVEKPFGRDLQSAAVLNQAIAKCFDESQIYRIDHYLGKETVQNILMFRFANNIFEPLWNRNYIDHIQITIAESVGIEHRGGYYDKSGAIRDMFQNHMLQMLALAAMESPNSFNADSIRDEKVKLLRSIRPFDLAALDNFIIPGQYGRSSLPTGTSAYIDEPQVEKNSRTETFVAAKLFIDNLRWKDTPFYLRTGKALATKDSEIAITFKTIPHSMFFSAGLTDLPPNVLVMQIQPQEGISLSFQTKRPGSKICMSTLNMSFNYSDIFDIEMPESYQRLLLDCMTGDQTLFTRYDSVETAWQLLTPVLESWQTSRTRPIIYPAGCDSFPQADNLIQADGRHWRKLGHI